MDDKRLQSLDALRGFTIFWIIGGGALILALKQATDWEIFHYLDLQLNHVEWNGFHFLDLIFPLFMFVSGVAIPYSIGRKIVKGYKRKKLLIRAAKRTLILIILGIIYNNTVSFDFANLRYASVLGQIGVAYFFTASIYLYGGSTIKQILWFVGILIGFWAAMVFIPVPGFGAGVLTPEGNLSGYIDRLLLPGKMYREFYDPQGALLMLSAITITLAGSLTGTFLKNEKYSGTRKCRDIAIFGIFLVILSLIWNIWYPINKEIWSSSFNVLTIGLSMILMSLFYFIIDVKNLKRWSFFFVVIGLNPITIYMGYRMLDFYYTSEFLLTGVMSLSGKYSNVVVTTGVIALEWGFLYFLYRKKIFLRV